MATTRERAPIEAAAGSGGSAVAKRSRSKAWASRTFDSLGERNFRYLWLGMLLSTGGFQMQNVARGILVYDLTEDAFLVSMVSMGFAPSLLIVSLFGGVISDTLERRSVIQFAQGMNALLSLVVAALIVTGSVHWVQLLIVSVFQGAMFALQNPARQAVIPMLVGRERMSNAIALNSVAMGLMNLVGPGLGGVIYGLAGPEAVYFTIAGMGLAAVGFTAMLPRMRPPANAARREVIKNIKDGLVYIKGSRLLMMLLLQSMVIALLSMPARMQIIVFAEDVYGSGELGVGVITAAAGVGALVGALGIAGLRSGQRRGLVLLAAAVLSGVSVVLLGSVPVYEVGIAMMIGIGLGESARWALGQSLIMEQTADEYRARVMSVLMMTFGLMPLGVLPLGYAMEEFGSQVSFFWMGVALLVTSIIFMALSRGIRRMS